MKKIPNNHRLDGAKTLVNNEKKWPTSTGDVSRISEPSAEIALCKFQETPEIFQEQPSKQVRRFSWKMTSALTNQNLQVSCWISLKKLNTSRWGKTFGTSHRSYFLRILKWWNRLLLQVLSYIEDIYIYTVYSCSTYIYIYVYIFMARLPNSDLFVAKQPCLSAFDFTI